MAKLPLRIGRGFDTWAARTRPYTKSEYPARGSSDFQKTSRHVHDIFLLNDRFFSSNIGFFQQFADSWAFINAIAWLIILHPFPLNNTEVQKAEVANGFSSVDYPAALCQSSAEKKAIEDGFRNQLLGNEEEFECLNLGTCQIESVEVRKRVLFTMFTCLQIHTFIVLLKNCPN